MPLSRNAFHVQHLFHKLQKLTDDKAAIEAEIGILTTQLNKLIVPDSVKIPDSDDLDAVDPHLENWISPNEPVS